MPNKINLRKKIKLLLCIFLVIIVSYTTITLFKNYQNNNYNFFIPTFNESYNEQSRKLEELQYSSEEIKIILNKVSEKNINYLIDNKINKSAVIKIVKEQYYIDTYLEQYISYYNDNQNKDIKDIIAIINTHSLNTNTEKTDISKKQFTILNKYYNIDSSYPNEEEFITIDTKYHLNKTETKMKKIAYDAFIKMYEEAPEDSEFKITFAYRSYSTQEALYNYELSQNPDANIAKAGHSEHQTGYSIDIDKSNTWLKENAHKYGFILRYPENKEYLTGYKYSDTHYRYCGIDCATYIYENKITYEEYYEYFIKHNN
jgi:D-alanyl-D-alanine carboxypeptidase